MLKHIYKNKHKNWQIKFKDKIDFAIDKYNTNIINQDNPVNLDL